MARKAFNGADVLNATLEDDYASTIESSPPALALRAIDPRTYPQILENTDSTDVVFFGTLGKGSIRKSSFAVTAGAVTGTDDGAGAISGTGISTGTINYTTGVVSITFSSAVTDTGNVRATFKTVRSSIGGEFIAGEVTFPEWTPESVVELFGFEPQEIHAYEILEGKKIPKTRIVYRMSFDGGTTFNFWDGSAWSAIASDEDWNDWVTVDREIGNVTFDSSYGSKSITLRAKLIPGYHDPMLPTSHRIYVAPRLVGVNIYHELQYEFVPDILHAMKNFCDDNVKVLEKQVVMVANAGTTITMQVNKDQTAPIVAGDTHSVAFSAPPAGIKCYDLTNDLGRTTELAFTFDGTDIITLDDAVSGVTAVEVQYYATIPCYVSADERFETSTSRAIVIFAEDSQQHSVHKARPIYEEIEPDFSNRQVRKRIPTEVHDFRLTCFFQSPHLRQASSMVGAFKRALSTQRELDSPATGQPFKFLDNGVVENQSSIQDGLEVKSFTLDIRGKVFYPDYTTESTVKEVNSQVGNTQAPYFTFTNIVTDESDVPGFDGANAEMAFIINSPAVTVWDRNGLRAGVYTTISGALASMPATGGKMVLGAGIFAFTSALTISKNGITIEGSGPDTILRPFTSSVGILDVSGDNFTLKDVKVEVATVTNDQALVKITGDNKTIENVLWEITGTTGSTANPSICLELGDGTNPHYGAIVRNNRFIPNAGIICIRSRKGSELDCHGNVLYAVSASGDEVYRGIDLLEEDNFRVASNKFINLGESGSSIDKCLLLTTCSFGRVEENHFEPVSVLYAMSILGCNNVDVTNNQFRGITTFDTGGHVLYVDVDGGATDTTYLKLSGNTFTGCGASAKFNVKLESATYVSILDNCFWNCQSEGLSLTETTVSTVKIIGNMFEDGNSLAEAIDFSTNADEWLMAINTFKGFTDSPPWSGASGLVTIPNTGSINQVWS